MFRVLAAELYQFITKVRDQTMRTRIRIVLAVGVVAAAVFMNGCLFNLFQTAKLVGAGNVALTIGAGLMDISIDETNLWTVAPQARLTFGLSDVVDLGFQTGVMLSLADGTPSWMGAIGDLKFSLFADPEAFSLSLGFGGGYGVEFLGWGLFGEVLFDSNLKVLPIFIVYQPTIPLAGGEFVIWHHLAGGLKLTISETTRLLLQVDFRAPLISFGFAVDIAF